MPATSPTAVPSFRNRIGCDARSGYYPAQHRYRLHLSPACPHCLQIAVTHSLLGLDDTLPVMLLPAVPDAPGGGHRALRPLYEASSHQHLLSVVSISPNEPVGSAVDAGSGQRSSTAPKLLTA